MAKSRKPRNGSAFVPTLIAVTGCAAAIALMMFLDAPGTNPSPEDVQSETGQGVAQAQPEQPGMAVQDGADSAELIIPDNRPAVAVPAVAKTKVLQPVQKTESPDSKADTPGIAEYIAAGEFGAALSMARSIPDATQRNNMIRQIALAQIESGEHRAALMSLRQFDDRDDADVDDAADSLAGGASLADFTELTNLIQTTTSGPWQDIDGTGGTMTPYTSGVMASPMAMLPMLSRVDTAGRLESLGLQARQAELNDNVAQPSELRLVSLRKLEAAVASRLADGQPAVETMKNMAGLYSVKYIFTTDDGDIILGGPAGAWSYNAEGQSVATESGRPTLQMDDLVTVLRTFSDSGQQKFRCSIDPREAGLKQLKDYVEKSNARGPIDARRTGSWVRSLQRKLGMQDVTINGVPANSRVARVIFEADYRMKLIGIGKLAGVNGMPSFFDLLSAAQQSNPPSILGLRWWLTMKYDSVLQSPNRDVFEIAGSSVLCQSENEFLSAQGKRIATGSADAVNAKFAQNFTEHYPELAQRDLVFADLQNVFDLALVAALVRHESLDAGWDRGVFATHGEYRTEELVPTTEINTVVNHRVYNGKDVVVQVAGGVRGDVMPVVTNPQQRRESANLQSLNAEVSAENGWWWDAK